jgi:ABC-type branched-subunit amino acid transport system permease subunit
MRTLPRRIGVAIIVAAIVVFLSIKLNAFRDYQIAEIAVYVTAVAGLTVLTGLSGQISLGNGAFMAIGAYATALLVIHLAWPFYLVLVVAAVITAVAGAVVGIAAARLRGPYLAGATLLLGVALPSIAFVYPGVFGADQGLNVVFTAPAFLGVNSARSQGGHHESFGQKGDLLRPVVQHGGQRPYGDRPAAARHDVADVPAQRAAGEHVKRAGTAAGRRSGR